MTSLLHRFKKGIKEVTPLQQAKAKRFGILGQMVGILLVGGAAILQELYWWIPLIFFTIALLVIEFISVQQQFMLLEEMEKEQW